MSLDAVHVSRIELVLWPCADRLPGVVGASPSDTNWTVTPAPGQEAAVARESRLDGRRVGQRDDDGAGPRSEVARRGGRRCAESDDLLHALGRDVVDDHVAVLAHEMPRVQAPDDPRPSCPTASAVISSPPATRPIAPGAV